jgi:septal ring factor EnvC (AmiA/AmiB activator)
VSKSNQDTISDLNKQIHTLKAEKADLDYKLRNTEYTTKSKDQEIANLRTELRVAQAKTEQSEKLFSILTAKPAPQNTSNVAIWNPNTLMRDPRF